MSTPTELEYEHASLLTVRAQLQKLCMDEWKAELDIEALKSYIAKPERTHRDELWLDEQLPVIIAALEDRERLQRELNTCSAWLKYDIDGLGTPEEVVADRDRLRAAAEAVYVDEAGFCHGIGKLRSALEGRDGL